MKTEVQGGEGRCPGSPGRHAALKFLLSAAMPCVWAQVPAIEGQRRLGVPAQPLRCDGVGAFEDSSSTMGSVWSFVQSFHDAETREEKVWLSELR